MPLETEVKVAGQPDELRRRLRDAQARHVAPRVLQDDAIYDTPEGRLHSAGCMLRLRRAGPRSKLTFKGPIEPDERFKSRQEHETELDDADAMASILAALGYGIAMRYQKVRERFEIAGATVVLDETPIGWFLELEGLPEQILVAAEHLRVADAAFESRSYRTLFIDGGGSGDMLFDQVPDCGGDAP